MTNKHGILEMTRLFFASIGKLIELHYPLGATSPEWSECFLPGRVKVSVEIYL